MSKGKKTASYLASCVLICLLLSGVAFLYLHTLNNMLLKENYEYLNEISSQNAIILKEKFESSIHMMQAMATIIGTEDDLDIHSWMEANQDQPLFSQFFRIGIIFPDGRGYSADVNGTDFSDRIYFKEAMAGNNYISDMMIDRVTGVLCYTYAVPIFRGDEVIAVLAAVTSMDTFQRTLFTSPYMGKGYTYIIKITGEPVLYSKSIYSDHSFHNFFDNMEVEDYIKQEMKTAMLAGKSGRLEYYSRGKDRFLSYVPLGINNWYVLSIVPAEVVRAKTESIVSLTALSCGIIILVILVFILVFFLLHSRSGKKLRRLAYYDDLTGLYNKNGFHRQTAALLSGAQTPMAYCVLDIKRFRMVNDRFGYDAGDALLRFTANVLTESLYAGEAAARISADEFHLMIKYTSREELEKRFDRTAEIIQAYSFPTAPDLNIQIGAGLYLIDDTELPPESMGDMAKLALNHIRQLHAAGLWFYTEQLQDETDELQSIEKDMLSALKNHEFQVYIQPQYSLRTGRIAGAEALVRWLHPQKGLIFPDRFIPCFEKNGFISQLDMYMFEQICSIIRSWLDAGITPLPVSVNQSRLNLFTPDYIDKLTDLLNKYDVPPRYIRIEMTESVFWNDTDAIISLIHRLHELGFEISMDDFGSGYSSLNMLQDLMLDELKIDKNFFRGTSDSIRGRIIVTHIIDLAKALNITIVAEGVETAEQVEFLKQTGCHLVQGYYYSKPVPYNIYEQEAELLSVPT